MGGDRISDASVREATGHGWQHWFDVMDRFPEGSTHARRVQELAAAHPGLSGWWQQMLSVQYERGRGLRAVGQAHDGRFQVGCSRTVAGDVEAVWRRLLRTPMLVGDWSEGATWTMDGARIEVRRVDPGRKLRWSWHDGDRSTVEVDLEDRGGRTTVHFRHHGLATDTRGMHRARWRAVLGAL